MHSGTPSCGGPPAASSRPVSVLLSRLVPLLRAAVPAPSQPRRLAAPSPGAALLRVRPGQSCKSRRRARRALSFAQPSSPGGDITRTPYILQRALRFGPLRRPKSSWASLLQKRGGAKSLAAQISFQLVSRSSAGRIRRGSAFKRFLLLTAWAGWQCQAGPGASGHRAHHPSAGLVKHVHLKR